MDLLQAPKLLVAGLVGVTIGVGLTRPPASDSVLLTYEWVQSNTKSETVFMRVPLNKKSTITQGTRVLEATPKLLEGGVYSVDLRVTTLGKPEAAETISTEVRGLSGETNAVYGTTRKAGRNVDAKLFFLTITPVESK